MQPTMTNGILSLILIISPNIRQHTCGGSAAVGDEVGVPTESACVSAGHPGAKSGHRSPASAKGAHAGGRTQSGPQQVVG